MLLLMAYHCTTHIFGTISGLQRAVLGGCERESHSGDPAMLARSRGCRELQDNAGGDERVVQVRGLARSRQ